MRKTFCKNCILLKYLFFKHNYEQKITFSQTHPESTVFPYFQANGKMEKLMNN